MEWAEGNGENKTKYWNIYGQKFDIFGMYFCYGLPQKLLLCSTWKYLNYLTEICGGDRIYDTVMTVSFRIVSYTRDTWWSSC